MRKKLSVRNSIENRYQGGGKNKERRKTLAKDGAGRGAPNAGSKESFQLALPKQRGTALLRSELGTELVFDLTHEDKAKVARPPAQEAHHHLDYELLDELQLSKRLKQLQKLQAKAARKVAAKAKAEEPKLADSKALKHASSSAIPL